SRPSTASHASTRWRRWRPARRGRSGRQVGLQAGREAAELAQRARLDLPDALAGDAEVAAEVLERLRRLAVEAEAARDNVAHARLERVQGLPELDRPGAVRRLALRRLRALVLDQVGVHALAVPHRRLQGHRVGDELEQLVDARRREAGLLGDLL